MPYLPPHRRPEPFPVDPIEDDPEYRFEAEAEFAENLLKYSGKKCEVYRLPGSIRYVKHPWTGEIISNRQVRELCQDFASITEVTFAMSMAEGQYKEWKTLELEKQQRIMSERPFDLIQPLMVTKFTNEEWRAMVDRCRLPAGSKKPWGVPRLLRFEISKLTVAN